MTTVAPFRIHIPDDTLDDLRARLRRTRLLPDSAGRPPSGLTAEYLATLVDSWEQFDWRARERWLNEHPQIVTDIDGARIHAVHVRCDDPDAPAILVMHGWPHTFALQLDFADRLRDHLHVVVVSLPGFGFSTSYDAGIMDDERLARTMNELMTERLGYALYLTYGEDVSASVSDVLAVRYPQRVCGVIATHAHFDAPTDRASESDPEVAAFWDRLARDRATGGAYSHVQSTRPDTLAVGLNDSPAGLLAWLVEKLVEWADVDAHHPPSLEGRISRERVLTEATIYWATQTISSSFRPYFEEIDAVENAENTEVPAAVLVQRHEADYPEVLARRFYRDLRVFERLPEGGHFTAAEIPDELARRVLDFARSLAP